MREDPYNGCSSSLENLVKTRNADIGNSTSVALAYKTKPSQECNASEIAATNVAKREYQKKYMDYWNSTKEKTGTNRPVDALIMPLAPFAAARPKQYKYYGYSVIINLLDYTSCAFPVSVADKSIDAIDHEFQPINNRDKEIMATCMYFLNHATALG